MNRSTDNKALWPGWETVRLIGRGSFGAVYEIERDVFGHKEKAALKMVSIPQSGSDIDELISDGYDEESITKRFEGFLQDIVREYSLMADMKGCANIVYCDDVKYVQHDDGIGWDIFIKMELLTPLTKALPKTVTDELVITVGKDICSALAYCEMRSVLHRDIKPQNIFVAPDGTYKLGDFGIAKTAEHTTSGTKTGTYKYMAPEVYNNQPYGTKADIYSLGLVLYWLLNERRTPFLPLPPEMPTASDEDRARSRRFAGEKIPAPAHGSEKLKQIVLKACAYDPKDRYRNAEEMLAALESIGKPAEQEPIFSAQPAEENDDPTESFGWKAKVPEPEEDKTVGAWTKPKNEPEPEEEKTVGTWSKTEPDKPAPAWVPEKKSGKKKIIGIIAVCLALVLVAGIIGITAGGNTNEIANETGNRPSVEKANPIVAVSAGGFHTVDLRTDGTVVAVGYNDYGQCDVSDWRDIVSICAGPYHTVGLRSDGTVVAAGYNDYGQCDVSDWSDIASISAGRNHTMGLRSDGTVVAAGDNKYGQCDVSGWSDIVAISAGDCYTVGLKPDGTVVAAGCYNDYGQYDVSGWRDIVAVSAGAYHIVGLCADGTVMAVGDNWAGKCDVSGWSDIVSISAGDDCTVGLRSDGTVVAVGDNSYGQCDVSDWSDIVSISAGVFHTVGLRSDGTVVAVGSNNYGQCDVSGG